MIEYHSDLLSFSFLVFAPVGPALSVLLGARGLAPSRALATLRRSDARLGWSGRFSALLPSFLVLVAPRVFLRLRPAPSPLPLAALGRYIWARGLSRCGRLAALASSFLKPPPPPRSGRVAKTPYAIEPSFRHHWLKHSDARTRALLLRGERLGQYLSAPALMPVSTTIPASGLLALTCSALRACARNSWRVLLK